MQLQGVIVAPKKLGNLVEEILPLRMIVMEDTQHKGQLEFLMDALHTQRLDWMQTVALHKEALAPIQTEWQKDVAYPAKLQQNH